WLRARAATGPGSGDDRLDAEREREALRLYRRAIELDPGFAAAYAGAALRHGMIKARGWTEDLEAEVREAARLARRAADLDRNDAETLVLAGHALAQAAGELEAAAALIDRGLALNPNLGVCWHLSAWVRLWSGDPELGIEHFQRAMRLSPLDPMTFW